jgi:hypothetical protein
MFISFVSQPLRICKVSTKRRGGGGHLSPSMIGVLMVGVREYQKAQRLGKSLQQGVRGMAFPMATYLLWFC